MRGHDDWLHSICVNQMDDTVVSGDIKSNVFVWDLNTLREKNKGFLAMYPEVELNVIMGMESDPHHKDLFYAIQRSGHLTLSDMRIPFPHQLHFRCHHRRASAIRPCFLSPYVATSARGSEIKLWDLRKISSYASESQYIQIYNQHESERLSIGFDFLLNEKLIVTGSDSFFAYMYDLVTGELVKRVKLAPEQIISVSAESKEGLSFYAIFNNGASMGIVDSDREAQTYDFTSTEQIKDFYKREAYTAVLSQHGDSLVRAYREIQGTAAVNFEQMIPLVSTSESPVCKQIMRAVTADYESHLRESTPRLVRDLQGFYKDKARGKKEEGEVIRKRRKVGDGKKQPVVKVSVEKAASS